MATTIKLKNGSGAPLAGDLVQGEPALDLTNKRLYTEDSGGSVIEVGTNPTSLTTGTFTSTGIDDNATSTAITIDANENVGIGTTSPFGPLDVKAATNIHIGIDDQGSDALLYTATDAAATAVVPLKLQANSFKFSGSSEFMRIDSSGNVGIGGTGATEKLYVAGDVRVGNTKIKSDGSGGSFDMAFETFSGGYFERMRIDSSGNVGIGTASPARKLTVSRDVGSSIVASFITANTGEGVITFSNATTTNDTQVRLGCDANDMVMYAGAAERMRIDSSGNLLVGTTDPSPNGTTTNARFVVSHGSSVWGLHLAAQVTSLQYQIAFTNPNGLVGRIETTGSATSYVTSSDVRLKEKIVDAPAGNIDAIRVRSFDWKADGSHQAYGMVAQELVDVAPEAVSQGATEEDMWGVDYSKLVPMMIKEIQDLKAEVAALKGA